MEILRPFRVPARLRVLLACALTAAVLAGAGAAQAQRQPFTQNPEGYVCPGTEGAPGLECFLNAVEHLYTMCRQVKSIEIIEFGYQDAEQGVNGAKSEYCVDKHKGSIAKPYQAALREARGSKSAVEMLRGLHDLWVNALQELRWRAPESDDEYRTRVARPYEAFRERAAAVREAVMATASAPVRTARPTLRNARASASSGRDSR
jgi:hypothetical protein